MWNRVGKCMMFNSVGDLCPNYSRKAGFTLVELLVYMAILGVVVLVAGQALTDSTKFRIRTQNMLVSSQNAESVANLLKDDIAQMGAKEYETDKYSGNFVVVRNVFMHPDDADASQIDMSSYFLQKGSGEYDSLYFRRIRYDDDGKYVGLEEVSWYVHDGKLYRRCKRMESASGAVDDESCPSENGMEVMIVDDVSRFKVLPAKPNLLESSTGKVLFPPPSEKNPNAFRLVSRYDGSKILRLNVDPELGGDIVKVTGFVSNYDVESESYSITNKINQLYAAQANGLSGTWSELCTEMTFTPGAEYEVSFKMPILASTDYSQSIVPGRDHLSVGLRTKSGEKISRLDDFMFSIPNDETSANVARTFRFSVTNEVKACLAFTFVIFSPLAEQGSMNISNLSVKKVQDVNYVFDETYTPEIADKKNIRAFYVDLRVNKHGEQGGSTYVFATPSNGSAVE